MHQALQKNYSIKLHPLHNLQESWLLDHTSILHEFLTTCPHSDVLLDGYFSVCADGIDQEGIKKLE